MKPVLVVSCLFLALLMILPSPYLGISWARAVSQTNPTTWLPFGPNNDGVLLKYYSSYSAMFNSFTTGGSNGIDLTDWPMSPSQLATLCPNPDFFCGSSSIQNGIFRVDINHAASFLGIAQLRARSASGVGVTQTVAAGCGTGFGSVAVTLQNQETGTLDPLTLSVNILSLTQVLGGVPSGTTFQSGPSTTGVYSFPCITVGTYLLRNSAYANCLDSNLPPCEINLGSSTADTVVFHSNWNSPSTQTLTTSSLRWAIAHLLNKVDFIQSSPLQNLAQCDDILASVPQGFNLGFCTPPPGNPPNCNGTLAPNYSPSCQLPPDVRSVDCSTIHAIELSQLIPPANQIPVCSTATAEPGALGGSNYPSEAFLLSNAATSGCTLWWGTTGCTLPSPADHGYPSKIDIQASCDLFVAAGLTVTGGNCSDLANAAELAAAPAAYAHLVLPSGNTINNGFQQIISYISTDPARQAFGTIIADSLNLLFGTPNNGAIEDGYPANTCAVNFGFKSAGNGCSPSTYSTSSIGPSIFDSSVNWNLYTGWQTFAGGPDQLYGSSNSLFAGSICGGVPATGLPNYDAHCDPKLDAYTSAGEHAAAPQQLNIFQNASYLATEEVAALPVYSPIQQFVALNCLNFQPSTTASLVNGPGTGWLEGTIGSYNTLLNAHSNPGYTPTAAKYSCDQGIGPILRRGQSQDSDNFSPFQATSAWDLEIISEIWDSLLARNPQTIGPGLQTISWTGGLSTTFNPNEVSCSPGTGCVAGTTTEVWRLGSLSSAPQFHDLSLVTSDDVCFSILAYRDMPSVLFRQNVINVASCTALDQSTVQVKLSLSGAGYAVSVGSVPIIPHHIWALPCSWSVGSPEPSAAMLAASQCSTTSFDPMATGLMIGSGPFECLTVARAPSGLPAGTPGGTCSQDAAGNPTGQALTIGGTLLLTMFPNYQRGTVNVQGSNYQRFSWADKFDQGVVSIADIADAAFHYHSYDPYWASPLFSASPATCSATGGPGTGNLQCVDIGDIATIAFYFHRGATDPISPPSSVVGIDPNIDKYDVLGEPPPNGPYYIDGSLSGKVFQFTLATGTDGILAASASNPSTAQIAGCVVRAGSPVPPDGPGRADYQCTFANNLTGQMILTIITSNSLSMTIRVGSASGTPPVLPLTAFFACGEDRATRIVTCEGGGSGGTQPYAYSWNFGDGSAAANGISVSHLYASDGFYAITLTITDANGATAQFTQQIISAPGLVVTFSPANPTHANPVGFTATASGDTTYSFTWNFGDNTGDMAGGSANPNTISHTYSAAGTYSVTTTVTDAGGFVSTVTTTVIVS